MGPFDGPLSAVGLDFIYRVGSTDRILPTFFCERYGDRGHRNRAVCSALHERAFGSECGYLEFELVPKQANLAVSGYMAAFGSGDGIPGTVFFRRVQDFGP